MPIATSNGCRTTCSLLNQLVQACVDSERCFRAAINDIEAMDLRDLFATFARQHADFVLVLDAEVERLGGMPSSHGTFAGTLFRGWMNFKSEVSGFDEATVLADCERNEARTLATYQQVVEEGLPPEIEGIALMQLAQIQKAHDTLRSLAVGSRT